MSFKITLVTVVSLPRIYEIILSENIFLMIHQKRELNILILN